MFHVSFSSVIVHLYYAYGTPMKTEKQLQNYLKTQASSRRIMFDKLESKSRRGFPDIMLAYYGEVYFVELKSPAKTGKLSPLQSQCLNDMRAHALNVDVIDSKEGVDELISEIMCAGAVAP